jgi:hypothetical protein
MTSFSQDFEDLRNKHSRALTIYNESQDEVCRKHTEAYLELEDGLADKAKLITECADSWLYYDRSVTLLALTLRSLISLT